MNDRHPIKYWIAKSLNALNHVLRYLVLGLIALVSLPYLAVLALLIAAFVSLTTMNEGAERLFGLKKVNLLIQSEKAKSKEELEDILEEMNKIP